MTSLSRQAERIRDIAIAARHALAAALAPVLMAQVREAVRDVESGATPAVLKEHQASWERQIMEAKLAVALEYAVDGYRLGEAALGKSAAIHELLCKEEGERWVTMNGTHVLIGGDDPSPIGGEESATVIAKRRFHTGQAVKIRDPNPEHAGAGTFTGTVTSRRGANITVSVPVYRNEPPMRSTFTPKKIDGEWKWRNESGHELSPHTGKSAGIAELCCKEAATDLPFAVALAEESDVLISRRVGQDVRRYVAETSKLETASSIDRLSSIFTRDVAENKTVAEIARDFMDEGASWVEGQGRANLMARTMSQWAYNHGSMKAYTDAGVKSEWLASSDACAEVCLPLNGVVADRGGLFEGQAYPGHPNCVIGETPVFIPRGDALAGLVAAYCGPIVEITFADGRRMSVTANHMLLTPYGFARAQHLRKGDAILDCAAFERVILRDPNYDGYPARADEIVESLAEARSMAACGVKATAKNLNGDGIFCEGEIGIIRPDSLLPRHKVTGSAEHSSEQSFGSGCPGLVTLDAERNLAAMLKALRLSVGGVPRLSECPTFSRRHVGEPKRVGLGLRSADNTGSGETALDNGARHLPLKGDGLFRLPAGVRTARISRLRFRECSTHVYTLQTKSTLYTINGLVSSNCQCTVIPVLEA